MENIIMHMPSVGRWWYRWQAWSESWLVIFEPSLLGCVGKMQKVLRYLKEADQRKFKFTLNRNVTQESQSRSIGSLKRITWTMPLNWIALITRTTRAGRLSRFHQRHNYCARCLFNIFQAVKSMTKEWARETLGYIERIETNCSLESSNAYSSRNEVRLHLRMLRPSNKGQDNGWNGVFRLCVRGNAVATARKIILNAVPIVRRPIFFID